MKNEYRLFQVLDTSSTSLYKNKMPPITNVKFNTNGDFIAVGTNTGKVDVYHKLAGKKDFERYLSLTAHVGSFDFLRSSQVAESIVCLEWLPKYSYSNFFMTCNENVINLFKMGMKTVSVLKESENGLPYFETQDKKPHSSTMKEFRDGHSYSINSLSVNSDGETFVSSDDLSINMWNLEVSDECFKILDLSVSNIDDINEVITDTKMHPTHCNLLLWSSSQGSVNLNDLRDSSMINHPSTQFGDPNKDTSFFSVITSSIASVSFSNNERYVYARDYLNLKTWDIRKGDVPLDVVPVQDHVKPKLCDLYANDSIFDKFNVSASPDDKLLITGQYHNLLTIYNRKKKVSTILNAGLRSTTEKNEFTNLVISPEEMDTSKMNFKKKTLSTCWHPTENTFAVGAEKLFIFDKS